MTAPHAGLERRVVASLDAAPSRVPVVLGGCGTGRTTLLHALTDRFGRTSCQHRRRTFGQHARTVPRRGAGGVAVRRSRSLE
jgi:ABC-type hemin transport system ATPase subunit